MRKLNHTIRYACPTNQRCCCKQSLDPLLAGIICYIIGVRKDIQKEMNRYPGDAVTVTIQEI